MLDLKNAQFDYVPYPIGIATPAFDPKVYDELTSNFPPLELFKDVGNYGDDGRKYGLSMAYNPDKFKAFVASNAAWGRFAKHVTSKEFVAEVLQALNSHSLRLGLEKYPVGEIPKSVQLKRAARSLARLEPPREMKSIKTRWEFSILPGIGGASPPHTDHPSKVITLVMAMCKPGEWKDEYGGGTSVVIPKDERKIFNTLNEPLEAKEVNVHKTFHFRPNQCLVFIRTYNSWHAVLPTTAPQETNWRRSVNVNLVLS